MQLPAGCSCSSTRSGVAQCCMCLHFFRSSVAWSPQAANARSFQCLAIWTWHGGCCSYHHTCSPGACARWPRLSMISAHMSSSLRGRVFSIFAGPAFIGPVLHQLTWSGHAEHNSCVLAFHTLAGRLLCADQLALHWVELYVTEQACCSISCHTDLLIPKTCLLNLCLQNCLGRTTCADSRPGSLASFQSQGAQLPSA